MGLGEMKQRSIFSLLGLCIIGSAVGAASTVLVLDPEDRISVTRGAFLTLLGFIFFLSLFDFLNHVALKTAPGLRIRKKYQLTMGEVLDISNKLVSAVQAALSCFTGAVVCLWSCTRDFLHSSHFMSEAYAWFGAAYFFYDIWSMYKVHIYMNAGAKFNAKAAKSKMMGKTSGKGFGGGGSGELRANGDGVLSAGDLDVPSKQKSKKEMMTFLSYCKNEPVILMHHLFIGGFGFLVIVYLRGGLGDCIFGFVYLMELSTPFVSVRGILSHMKLKSTQLYVANGVAMLLTFFVCRIVMLPYVCYMYSSMIGLPYFEAIMSLPTGCKLSIMLLLLPQIYWFYLMVRGAYKVFFPPKLRLESGDSLVSAAANGAHSDTS